MSGNLTGLDELQSAVQRLIHQLESGSVDATQAAGEEILTEVQRYAKGTVRDSLTLTVSPTEHGAKGVIQVENSEPGGREHHAVYLEYGTSRMAAEPFMRPGFDAAAPRAVDRFTEVLSQKVKG